MAFVRHLPSKCSVLKSPSPGISLINAEIENEVVFIFQNKVCKYCLTLTKEKRILLLRIMDFTFRKSNSGCFQRVH